MRKNLDQKKLSIWTLFTQCNNLCGNALIPNKDGESYMSSYLWYEPISIQLTFSSSKSTIETLQKSLKYVQGNHKDAKMTSRRSGVLNPFVPNHPFSTPWKLWTSFTPFPSAFIADLEQLPIGHEDYNPENYTWHFLLRNNKGNVFTCLKWIHMIFKVH